MTQLADDNELAEIRSEYQILKGVYLNEHAALALAAWTRFLGRVPTIADYQDRHHDYVEWTLVQPLLSFERTIAALTQWRQVDHPRLMAMLDSGTTSHDIDLFVHGLALAKLAVQTAFGLDTADRNSADAAFLLGVWPHESPFFTDILPLGRVPYVHPEGAER